MEQITVWFDLNEEEVLLSLRRMPHIYKSLFVIFFFKFWIVKVKLNCDTWTFLMFSNAFKPNSFCCQGIITRSYQQGKCPTLIASLISWSVEVWKIHTCDFFIKHSLHRNRKEEEVDFLSGHVMLFHTAEFVPHNFGRCSIQQTEISQIAPCTAL